MNNPNNFYQRIIKLSALILILIFLGGSTGIDLISAAGPDQDPDPTDIPSWEDLDLHTPGDIEGAWAWYSGTIEYSWVTNCVTGYGEYGAGTYVSQWRDNSGGQPVPGQIYTLSVVVAGIGNPCAGQNAVIDIALPPNTSLAISGSAPVVCWGGPLGDMERLYPPDCPQYLPDSPRYYGAYEIESPEGVWPLAIGWGWEFLIPVVSSTTLSGSPFEAAVWILDGQTSPTLVPEVSTYVFSPPAPGAFNKFSPSNGASNQSTNLTLSWGASGGATSYEYCIDTSHNSTCNSSWVSVGTSTSKFISGLAAGTQYSWQVRAKNSGGTTYANSGSWWSFTTQASSGASARSDFDGDGESDPAKFYPGTGVVWWMKSSTSSWDSEWLGSGSFDYVRYSDFDGDSKTDPGKFSSSNGTVWYIKSSTGAWEGTYLGVDSYTYVAGNDFDGDGKSDPTKLLPNGAIWYPKSSTGAWEGFWVGPEAFEYVAGSDFDGDGKSDPAKYIADPGVLWYWKSSTSGWVGVFLGSDAYTYVSASDFDGDGVTDPAKFYASTGTVWWLKSTTGTWDAAYLGTGAFTFVGGNDFDGDGITDPAKYDGSTGTLCWLKSSTTTWDSLYLGTDAYELVN